MNPLRFTRRNLLRGGLAATAAVPLLEATHAYGQSTTPAPTRFVVFATPNGTRNSHVLADRHRDQLHAADRSPPISTPMKSKLTFLKGIRLNNALQNGALGGTSAPSTRAAPAAC